MHLPILTSVSDVNPPYVVVVVGPPKVIFFYCNFNFLNFQVGKTTLIKSLVKHYTKHSLTEVLGPITVVSGNLTKFLLVFYFLFSQGKQKDLLSLNVPMI